MRTLSRFGKMSYLCGLEKNYIQIKVHETIIYVVPFFFFFIGLVDDNDDDDEDDDLLFLETVDNCAVRSRIRFFSAFVSFRWPKLVSCRCCR